MKNYLKHSRPKGSRNGYTTMKDYKPVGTPAKGKLVNGRYVYEEDLKNGNLPPVPKDFNPFSNVKAPSKNQSDNVKTQLLQGTSDSKPVTKKTVGEEFIEWIREEPPISENKRRAFNYLKENAPKAAKAAKDWVSDYINGRGSKQNTNMENSNDHGDHMLVIDDNDSPAKKAIKKGIRKGIKTGGKIAGGIIDYDYDTRVKKQEETRKRNEENKKQFMEKREQEYRKQREQNAGNKSVGQHFVDFLLKRVAGPHAVPVANRIALDRERYAWEQGYDSYEDMQKGKRSKDYTGW